MTDTPRKANPMRRVMTLGDFRLLLAGTSLSLLGDQFALVATPWLVLQLTNDPLTLGGVLALEGLPKAAFTLIGGAITDRLSPRRIMLVADAIRLVLTALMALAVFTGSVEIWMLYGFGFGFGLVAGFALPAKNSIVPFLVQESDLHAGNSLVMGVEQFAGFVGPSLAGIVIGAYFGSLEGVGYAYAIDALSFAASAFALILIRGASSSVEAIGTSEPQRVFAAIRAALLHIWNDEAMRLIFLNIAAINFLMMGPLRLGIPLLARTRLAEGALAFGMLMSAFAAGNLAGMLIAGATPKPGSRLAKAILIGAMLVWGAVFGVLGFLSSTTEDAVLLLLVGLGNGYLSILLFTWLQTRTPKQMLGRVMSVLLLANFGLAPLSQAIAGAVGRWDLDALFVVAGGLTILTAFWTLTRPELTVFSQNLAAEAKAAVAHPSDQAPPSSPSGNGNVEKS